VEATAANGRDHHRHRGGASCGAKDWAPNAGVLLLRNAPITRDLIRAALWTHDDTEYYRTFTDQASLTAAIGANASYTECALLLRPGDDDDDEARLLQSRLRRWSLWEPGDWILHLPNHNRWEMLGAVWSIGGGGNGRRE